MVCPFVQIQAFPGGSPGVGGACIAVAGIGSLFPAPDVIQLRSSAHLVELAGGCLRQSHHWSQKLSMGFRTSRTRLEVLATGPEGRTLSFDARHSTTVGPERVARTSTSSAGSWSRLSTSWAGASSSTGETKATRGPSRSGLVALGSREPEAVTSREDRGTARRQRGQPAGLVQCVMLSMATGASVQLRDGGRGNGHQQVHRVRPGPNLCPPTHGQEIC